MKKALAISLVMLMMLFVSACTNENNNVNKNTKPVSNQSQSTAAKKDKGSDIITQKKAKEIALKHAGFSESEVNFLRVEYDYDDGFEVYEVDFTKDKIEYDYDIDAVSGEILSFDKDYD